ncbi:MAG: class II aldolase/adducin family protein [Deltaproteobacteria bacterium]|nr:class II aldolase/adducin family protein [Deltaproteobacteria bacterium]
MKRNSQLKAESPGESHYPPSKETFCRFCHLLYDRHLVTGVGGNMAARSGENILLTPSGYSLRDVEPDMVVTVNGKGLVIEGTNPTKDANMHLGVLHARPDVNVLFHVHGAYIVAASVMLEPGPDTLPPLTPGFVYYAYPLPMIPFFVPGTQILAKTVAEKFSKRQRRAVLLQNHGLVTLGKNFQEAINVAEEVDEAARIFVLTGGKAMALPSEDLEKIR